MTGLGQIAGIHTARMSGMSDTIRRSRPSDSARKFPAAFAGLRIAAVAARWDKGKPLNEALLCRRPCCDATRRDAFVE